jgi:hypothetical protein
MVYIFKKKNAIGTARQAAEPIFSVGHVVPFQTFGAVFRTGLGDPALANAIMLTFAFAVAGGSIDQECLGYQAEQSALFVRN